MLWSTLVAQLIEYHMKKQRMSAVWNAYLSVKGEPSKWFTRRTMKRYWPCQRDYHLNWSQPPRRRCTVNARVAVMKNGNREFDQFHTAKNPCGIGNLEKRLQTTSLVKARMPRDRWEAGTWSNDWKYSQREAATGNPRMMRMKTWR